MIARPLGGPGKPVIQVTTRPAAAAIKPTTQPAKRPTTRPAAKPTSRPTTRPTTRPASQPAVRQLTAKQVKTVQDHITKTHAVSLWMLGLQHKMAGKTVSADLEIAPNGQVQQLRIKLPKKEAVAFRKALSKLILRWKLPKMKQTRACTLKLTFPKGGIRLPEMFEMAPRDGTHKHERAPRPNR